MKYVTKPEYIDAIQWTKQLMIATTPIPGVHFEKFVPTGHWSDRFNEIPDGPWVEDRDKRKIILNEGDFIITYSDGTFGVMDEKTFHETYQLSR